MSNAITYPFGPQSHFRPQLTGRVPFMLSGDSITQGFGSTSGAGLREPLASWYWPQPAGIPAFDAQGPANSTQVFPNDRHDGYVGHTIADFNVNGQNDLVLLTTTYSNVLCDILMIGTNDTLLNADIAAALVRYESLLQYIFSLRPDLRLGVTTITPRQTSQIANPIIFNAGLPPIWQRMRALGQRLLTFDAFAAINDPATQMFNNAHPNDAGYARLATVYRAVLCQLAGYAPS